MSGKIDDMLRFDQTALKLRSHRQQTLASNIANADTPNYKARDFDFTAALSSAVGSRGNNVAPAGGLGLATTSTAHIGGGKGVLGAVNLAYRGEVQSSIDGNTVDMDTERANFAENTMHMEVLMRLISDRFQGLKTAINGQ